MATNDNVTKEAPLPEPKLSCVDYLKKVWQYRKYLVIEQFLFFYVMASIFNAVARQNFPLDKACRVNLGYDKIVCDNTLDKSKLNIVCESFSFENTTLGATPDLLNTTIDAMGFNYTVCKALHEAHGLAADVSAKRSSIAAIFPLIVIIFAGGWSDRHNKLKPCMILPIFGEMCQFICLLISAIFFDSLPMEFGAYLEAIVPALFGGSTLCIMAIFSYMTIVTPEKDRIFRFGIFAMFGNGIPAMGMPISGFLYLKLGYVGSFLMAALFQVIAILCVIFYIKEVKSAPKEGTTQADTKETITPPLPILEGAENLAYEVTKLDEVRKDNKNVIFEMTQIERKPTPKHELPAPGHLSCCMKFFIQLRDFFDPTLLLDLMRFPLIKRKNNGRMLLALLICANFLILGPLGAESEYWSRYQINKLNWNENDRSFYDTFSLATGLLGTFIGTAILSKWLNISISLIGALAALSIVCSRVIYAFARTTVSYYAGGAVEMFITLSVLALKTIGSSIIDEKDLSKMYSIFGICEPIGQFIFPFVYSEIYQNTINSFPGAFYLIGEIFYVPNVLIFLLCYFILRRNKKQAAVEEKLKVAAESDQGEQNEKTTKELEQ